MAIEAKQFEDAEFAAQYFADAGDANAAQRKLSEDGAQVNLMVVTICLAKEVQKLRGVGTPEHEEELLADENTPASQRDAIQRGVDNADASASADSKETSKEENPPAPQTPSENQPASNAPLQTPTTSSAAANANENNEQQKVDSFTSLNLNR